MGRKVSIGVVGSGGGLGTIVAGGSGNTLTTAVTNQNLIIDPNGTGITQIVGAAQLNAQSELRLADADSSNYIGLKAAGTIGSNYTLTWPAAVTGVAGYALTSAIDGTLSWTSLASGGVAMSDPGASATVHYPVFLTNAGSISSSQATGFNNRANLSFIPSTGELTATALNAANHYGSAANSGTITIRGTTSATKATASVLMTDGVASSTTATGTLVVTGGVGISGQMTATTIVETSSIVFKENVMPIENALESVLMLMGVTYDRKDNKEHEAGLIAEEVYKIIPDLVSKDANGDPHGIKYSKLTAYLIEAIKSLKQEINELKR
jgi:Chaperone of endosialidase